MLWSSEGGDDDVREIGWLAGEANCGKREGGDDVLWVFSRETGSIVVGRRRIGGTGKARSRLDESRFQCCFLTKTSTSLGEDGGAPMEFSFAIMKLALCSGVASGVTSGI